MTVLPDSPLATAARRGRHTSAGARVEPTRRPLVRLTARVAGVPEDLALLLELTAVAVFATLVGLSAPLVLLWGAGTALVRGRTDLSPARGTPLAQAVRRAAPVAAATVGLGAVVSFLTGLGPARVELLVGAAACGLVSATVHLAPALARRATGTATCRAVIVGPSADVVRTLADLRRRGGADMMITGVCLTDVADTRAGLPDGLPSGVPVTSGVPSVSASVRVMEADAVIALPWSGLDPTELRRLEWETERLGAELYVASGLLDASGARVRLTAVGAARLLRLRQASASGLSLVVKQVWERVFAAFALLLLAPLLLVLAARIRRDGDGPAVFRQVRVGRDGREFTLLKLRTMYPDAEARLAALAALNDADGLLFKLHDDPRITPLGRVLRRYSLDELPQLWNVVRGDMSLVGPRPALPQEVAAYPQDTRRRLALKPGLTGLWQVSGRSDLPWEEAERLDLAYVDNWSLALDASIVLRTVRAVLGHQGAY